MIRFSSSASPIGAFSKAISFIVATWRRNPANNSHAFKSVLRKAGLATDGKPVGNGEVST
jgi:hypothetical protein